MVQVINRPPSFGEQMGQALGAGLGQGFANAAESFIQKQQDKSKSKAIRTEFDRLAQENPKNKHYKDMAAIWGMQGLSFDEKKAMVDSMFVKDPWKAERLIKDQRLNSIKSRIRMLDDRLKTSKYADRPPLEEERNSLEELYKNVAGLGDELTEEEEEFAKAKKSTKKAKTKFDPKNPEHMAKFNQLDKEFKNDKKKVNEILFKEFYL